MVRWKLFGAAGGVALADEDVPSNQRAPAAKYGNRPKLSRCAPFYYGLLAVILSPACSRSNNLLLGTVQANAGSHHIVVTGCYRLSVDPPREIGGPPDESGYRYTPCRDADVLIRGEDAIVNGRSYGHIGPTDSILVDHGVVSIGRSEAKK